MPRVLASPRRTPTANPRPPVRPRLAAEIAVRGWTHRYVAPRVGIHPTSVGDILTGKLRPSIALQERFAALFGIDREELFRLPPEVEYLLAEMRLKGYDALAHDERTLRDIALLARDGGRHAI